MSSKREPVEDPWRKPACFYDTDELFSGSDTEPLFGEVSESKRFDLSYLKTQDKSLTSDTSNLGSATESSALPRPVAEPSSNEPVNQLEPSDSGMISCGSEATEYNLPTGGLSKLRCMRDPLYNDVRKAVQELGSKLLFFLGFHEFLFDPFF